MARQVLPIVGAIVGSFFGAPQLGFAIGALIGNAVDPQVIKGPRIGESAIQTSAEGVYRPIVRGIAAVMGNVIERGNRRVKTERHSQGKGGPEVEEQRVFWTFAIRICEGPIEGVMRIWMDEKLVYDVTPESSIPQETSDFASKFRLYLGDENQLPDPDIEAYRGIGNVPAYRGSAYVVFPNFDLTDRRESIPNFRFEVLADGQILEWDYTWTFYPDPELGGVGNSKPAFGNGMVMYGSNQGIFKSTDGKNFVNTLPDTVDTVAFWEDEGVFIASKRYYPSQLWVSNGVNPWVLFYSEFNPGGGAVGTARDLPYALSLNSAAEAPTALVISHELTVIEYDLGSGPGYVTRLIRCERLGVWIAVCGSTMPVGQRIWYSESGITGWFSVGDWDTNWEDVIDVPELGLLIFCGSVLNTTGDTVLVTSPDLVTFNDLTDQLIPNTSLCGATYIPSSGEIVVVPISFFGGTGTFYVSTDGQTFEGKATFPQGSITAPLWCPAPINGIVSISGGGALGDGALLSNSSTEAGVILSDVVSGLHERVYNPASRYDVTELTDPVLGIVFAGDYTCADAIKTLMTPYFFDGAEFDSGTGYKIHYTKRGKPVVLTITEDDLIDAPEKSVREDSLERPKVLHLHYENPTVGYVPAKATDRRDSTDVLVVGEVSTQVPVAFQDVDEPAKIARKLMKVIWAEVAGEQDFTASGNLLRLVPGDCIGVSLRGLTYRKRITQEQYEGGELRWKLIADRQSAYTANVTGVPVPPPTPPLPSIVGPTIFEYLDIPALNDNNDRLLYYTAATGQSEAWYGATIQRKNPGASSFENATTFTQPTTMGELLVAVPSASEHYPDTTNVVHLSLYRADDELLSLTETEFLSEGGSFALEKPDGTWEIMQYRDAVQDSGGDWELSHLLRGRLNSGPSSHLVGARFVLLDEVQSVDATVAWLSQNLTHRAVSLGISADGSTEYVDPFVGQSQTEFPVAHILGEINGTNLNLEIIPRHRFGTEDHPVRSINWTGYRVSAMDGVNSFALDTLSATLTIDVTGWSTPITVTVSQLNRLTGAGPSVAEDFA